MQRQTDENDCQAIPIIDPFEGEGKDPRIHKTKKAIPIFPDMVLLLSSDRMSLPIDVFQYVRLT
jgi:hypothetical protein